MKIALPFNRDSKNEIHIIENNVRVLIFLRITKAVACSTAIHAQVADFDASFQQPLANNFDNPRGGDAQDGEITRGVFGRKTDGLSENAAEPLHLVEGERLTAEWIHASPPVVFTSLQGGRRCGENAFAVQR